MSLEEIQQRLQQLYNNQTISSAPSGYDGWDGLTGGLVRGGLTFIGSRPAMGSTSLVLNIAHRVAREQAGTVLIFAPDSSESEFAMRLMQIGMGMNIGRLFDGSLAPAAAIDKCHTLFAERKGNIQIYDLPCLSLDDICDRCFSVPDLQLVVVDGIEQIYQHRGWGSWNDANGPKRESMDRVIKFLQNLAQNCNVPVVCTAHMHRSLERRKDKHPKLEDLTKIDVPVNAVDQAVFLYRSCYYYFDCDDDTAQCIVAKTPYGQTGTFCLQWHPMTGEFSETEHS